MKNRLFKHFKGDFFGGITAGIVALPLALAFGVTSGLGPDAGLYGAIFIGIFAALFGGTPTQISGPTAPMTAVSLLVISGIVAANDGDVSKALPIILGVFLLAGLIQIALGFAGVGKYIRYIPYPVVSGFMTAIGVIIIITQLLPILGYYPKEDSAYVASFKAQAEEVLLEKILKEEAGEGYLVLEDFSETQRRAAKVSQEDVLNEAKILAKDQAKSVWGTIKVLSNALKKTNPLELGIALVTILIIFGFKKITTAIPSTLVALLLVSGISMGFELPYRSISAIPEGFPMPHLELFTEFKIEAIAPYLFAALSLALLGAIDSLLTSVVADNMTKTKHAPNKELIGQGIGNSIAAIFGGIPGAGATIRTVVNIKAGGKTKLSGVIAGILLLVILMLLGPVASKIPAAVLAGILMTVGIGVMDYKGLKAIPYIPISEVGIMLLVMLLSVFWDLVSAVGIGLVLASLIFMKKMGDVTSEQSHIKALKSNEDAILEVVKEGGQIPENVYVKHLNGPVFFGATNELQALSRQLNEHATHLIIRMEKVPYIDQSGLYTLEDILLNLKQKGIGVSITGIQQQPLYLLKRIKIVPDLIAEKHLFNDFGVCLEYHKGFQK
ncbi:SulP family inorganic anion transporter [Flavobacteriaceae bacterium]|nr:SulP family inorganic anion transporter [Flavobacteriaceae bacterium]MDB9726311.1 SulP family inorganic anion transporter [Flavobacteriaceae bacterium]|tara:strand:- start:1873 stop:3705 length:1833 start_codon:yes stop_codon:yes gene_type:complete